MISYFFHHGCHVCYHIVNLQIICEGLLFYYCLNLFQFMSTVFNESTKKKIVFDKFLLYFVADGIGLRLA